MKAVVVELKNELAAVLSEDGCIVTVKNNYYEVGQEIQMKNPKISYRKKLTAFAAAAAAIVVLSAGTWAYASPYTYVSLDVNPSIEFTVNRFDRVLKVKAINDDGEEILNEISLKDLENHTIEDAITKTVEQISEAGYFNGDTQGGIVIATSAKNEVKAEELAQGLQQSVDNEVTENGDDVEVEVFSVGVERVEEARALGVTPGKLNLVEKLQASAADPSTINLEEWLKKPVKDIMKATKDNKNLSNDTEPTITMDQKEQQKNQLEESSKKQEHQKVNDKAKNDKKNATGKVGSTEDNHKTDEDKLIDRDKESNKNQKSYNDKSSDKTKDETKRSAEKAKNDNKNTKDNAQKANNHTQNTKDDSKMSSNDTDKESQNSKGNTKNSTDNTNDDRTSNTKDRSTSGSDHTSRKN